MGWRKGMEKGDEMRQVDRMDRRELDVATDGDGMG